MQKIIFFSAKSYDISFFEMVNKKYKFNLKFLSEPLDMKSVHKTKGYEAVCIFVEDKVDKMVIDGLIKNNVKIIALRCAGFNNVDVKHAKDKIKIVRVPTYSPYAVAEHAMGLILSLNRKNYLSFIRTRMGDFSLDGMLGFDLKGKTLGVIGVGNIGKILINIAQGFNMKVIAYDPYLKKCSKKIKLVSLNSLLKKSDIISLHCPLTNENHYMINKKTISKMKDGVMIINTGRGKLINTKDLIKALKDQKVSAAGLDVYEMEENYFYKDYSTLIIKDDVLSRLLFFPNVLITSHKGYFTKEAMENISITTLKNIKNFFLNKKTENEVFFKDN
ncbi:MAG: hydroxyacid dehydrogenase [Chlamydiae bacterium RIFCSPHIGHO2_12_FULL_27_8]|nr:MAG: hydroxyacid dehydrogenase [Chlamydiae bacterium RIFCSPHIGHO2_12_FULL_27_8]